MSESPKVFLPDPLARFIRVSTSRPTPKRLPDVVIHLSVHRLCDDVPMVIGPAPDLGIEQINQGFLLRRAVRPDGLSNVIQKRLHVFGRRLDEKFAAVFAYILSEKVEALGDMRYLGLLFGELKTPLGEECLDERLDFLLQQLFRVSGNNEVE